MKNREDTQWQIDAIKAAIVKHGSSPEMEGMLHGLMWVVHNIRPTPASYADIIYGVTEEGTADATHLSLTGTTGVGQDSDRSVDSAAETSDVDRRGPESAGNGPTEASNR